MSEVKTKGITNAELFSLLFVSRFTALIISRGVSLVSLAAELLLSLLLCALVVILNEKINAESMAFRIFLSALGAVSCALTFYSVADFKKRAIELRLSMLFITVIILLAVVYSASLGLTAISRFAPVCLAVILSACAAVCLSVVKSADFGDINLLEKQELIPLNLLKCTDLALLLLLFSGDLRGNRRRAAFASVFCSYSAAAALYVFCIAVVGSAQKSFPYPVFTMFQLGSIASYDKLDILFTSPFLTGAFLKLSAFFYSVKGVFK